MNSNFNQRIETYQIKDNYIKFKLFKFGAK